MTNEPQLFDWDLPPRKTRRKPPPPRMVDRVEGWVLVVSEGQRQPHQWHTIKPLNDLGGVITDCNVIGRVVPDECEKIILCAVCAANAKQPPE